jgi:hypothetical protein
VPPPSGDTMGNENITPKLKKIGVPTFDGDVLSFQNFKNLFENLVHLRTELSNVQKLFYLKESLVGKAKDFIRDFPLVDDAYPEAWDYLLNRFNNKRIVIRTLFRRLIEIDSIKKSSQISSLVDQVDLIMRGLRANGLEIDQTFSKFACYYVASKLDNRTSSDWENSLTDVQEFPTYKKLCSFLHIRSFAVEEKNENTSSSSASNIQKPKGKEAEKLEKQKSIFAVLKAEKNLCVLCKNNHPIYGCEKFKSKTPKDRYKVVKINKLCLVCLGSGHNSSSCDRKKFKCSKCTGNHNYLLHFDSEPMLLSKAENSVENENEKVSYSCTSGSNSSFNKADKVVLLPTAIVRFRCGDKTGKARILLDSCSQASLISDSFAQKNSLPIISSNVVSKIKGIGGSTLRSLVHWSTSRCCLETVAFKLIPNVT